MPNQNAYLCVVLDAETMASLDNAVSTITASPELFNAPLGVQFDPVDEASRHMTFMFFGEHLRAMPGADLTALHAAFCEEVTAHSRDMAGLLSFRCFEFFPPTKMNLIAACFDPSPGLLKLREAMVRRTKACGVSLPGTLLAQLEEPWWPHVTLGKVRATKAQIGQLSCGRLQTLAPPGPSRPQGLTLLGETPPRAWCDWELSVPIEEDGAA
mmetsp:Transcript_4082/g.11472  ORF Transcript_4082/g.11472 Transcript_4082/m.11472 type:complete len:212 (-) Transcript_4082:13-648(-)